jgi:DNA repair protein RadC
MQTLYKTKSGILLLDNPNKKYVLTIHDIPQEEKPREKLQKFGPKVLSTPELLAVLLTTGTKKEDVLAMSARIMKEYGQMSIMSAQNAEKLSKDLAISLGKATQIIACAELGRRFYKKNDVATPTIRMAADVYAYVKDMRDLPKEHLRGIYLNAHYKVVHDEVISIGTVDTSIIHPREVFKPALEYAAAAVILVHNHPSGITEPSDADSAITRQLIEAGKLLGINLVDHVIVTKSGYASIPAEY